MIRRSRFLWVIALCCGLAALPACGAGCSRHRQGSYEPPPADDDTSGADDDSGNAGGDAVDVDPAAPGAAVPAEFLGISVEWSAVPDYLGDGTGGARATTVQLLRNFDAEGHRPVVRIGGNSEDRAWWNPDGDPPPPNVTIDLGPLHMATLAALNAELGTHLVLGLNLGLGDAANAAAVIDGAFAAIPREAVLAFEMGNEPDDYWSNGLRYLAYTWDAYVSDMEGFHDGVAARLPSPPPFAAPALGGRRWLDNLVGFLPRETDRLALVTTHIYPFTNCMGLPAPAPIRLLSDYATADLGAAYKPVARAAHDAGYAMRMGEMNSISCGGVDGVSNVYAAALWGADVAFQLAAAGLDGINFHTPSRYAVFSYDPSGALVVNPLYYGLRLFSLATARNGRLLPARIATAARVHGWATLGDDGAVRVALIREDRGADDSVSLRVPGRSGAATLVRLRAPSISAKIGLTLGGQTWDGSTDGSPLGVLAPEAVTRDGDAYVIPLPALEAVVVTVPANN